MATGVRNVEELMHRRKRRKRCTRLKCTFRVPLLGWCLSRTRVKVKCHKRRRRKRSR